MPELPEVETERGRLAARIEGTAHRRGADRRRAADAARGSGGARGELTGERVDAVERRGKYLVVRLESGRVLLVHLRMTGGFRYEPATHERAVLELDDGTRIAYRDVRRFGTWLLLEPEEVEAYLARRLGPEPLGRGFTAAYLARGSRAGARRSRRRSSTSRRSPASGTSTPTRRSGAPASIRCGRRAS